MLYSIHDRLTNLQIYVVQKLGGSRKCTWRWSIHSVWLFCIFPHYCSPFEYLQQNDETPPWRSRSSLFVSLILRREIPVVKIVGGHSKTSRHLLSSYTYNNWPSKRFSKPSTVPATWPITTVNTALAANKQLKHKKIDW